MRRIATISVVILAVLVGTAPAAFAKPPVPRSGTYEGVDQAGGVVSVVVDRRHQITEVAVPGPVDCPYIVPRGFAGARFGGFGEASIKVKAGRFSHRRRPSRITGRVLADGRLTGIVTSAISHPGGSCAHTWRFTVARFERPVADPTPGAWRGTDALGGTVRFEAWGSSYVSDIHIYGPWGACGNPAPMGIHAHFGGGSLTAYDRSRRTGRVTSVQTFVGRLGVMGRDGNGPVVSAFAAPGTTVVSRFDGLIVGAVASGTWQTRVTIDGGAVLCDSGPVAWSAAPAA